MKRYWIVTNPASGSADQQKCAAIEALLVERGIVRAGCTIFPDEPLPDAADLDRAGADTLVLFAGDGTINAAACKLDVWGGAALVLPGGTMNLLAKALHGEAAPDAIVHDAHLRPKTRHLPFVEAGPHRAFVALIAGPVATWAQAREMVRHGRIARLGRAVRLAWARSWNDTIRVEAGGRLLGTGNAVIVTPTETGLHVSAIAADRWRDVARLGWDWLAGDWRDAPAVSDERVSAAVIRGRRNVLALFDGEEVKLTRTVSLRAGRSELSFLTTVEAEA